MTEHILWISLCNLILELGILGSIRRAEELPHHPRLSLSHSDIEGNQWEKCPCCTEYICTLAFMKTCALCGDEELGLEEIRTA